MSLSLISNPVSDNKDTRKSGAGSGSRAAPGDAAADAETATAYLATNRESRKRPSTGTASSGGNNIPEEKILIESET